MPRLVPAAFKDIRLDAVEHRYFLGDTELTGVSRLVARVKEPYDAPAHAARLAPSRGMAPKELLAEWEHGRNESAWRGKEVHDYVAMRLQGAPRPILRNLPEMDAFEDWWQANRDDLIVLAVEMIVGDAELGVAGTLDLLVYSKRTQAVHVVDFKTNKRFDTETRYSEAMLRPFSDLDACHLVEYSLQVNTYRFILERALAAARLGLPDTVPEHHRHTTLGDCLLVHLSRAGAYREHVALDLMPRIPAWLEFEVPR
jgi:hypothetical protein